MSKGHPLLILMATYEANQKDIANAFEKTTHTIKKWLRGQGSPNMKDLKVFSTTFGKVETDTLARDWIEWMRSKDV